MTTQTFLRLRLSLFASISLLLLNYNVSAQATDPGRSMYVDNFCTLVDPNNPSTSATVPDFTILGTSKEAELFAFCEKNHITTLVLYQLQNVFPNPVRSAALCTFLTSARTHGIVKIGGAVSSSQKITDFQNFHQRQSQPTPGYSFTTSEQVFFQNNLSFQPLRDLVVTNYSLGDPNLELAEITKQALDIARFSGVLACGSGAPSGQHFDLITLENEFWNTNNGNPNTLYPSAKVVMDDMVVVRNFIASAYSTTIETEIYLGNLTNITSPSNNTVANFIDGNQYSTGTPLPSGQYLFNRMLFANYKTKPVGFFNTGSYNYAVYNAFQNNGTPSNLRATPFHPLLSSCSQDLGFGDPGFAKWFTETEYNSIFKAEREYYDQYNTYTNSSSVTNHNVTTPGAVTWYVYSQMIHDNFIPLANTGHIRPNNTFYTNSPVMCASGNTSGTVTFNYSGPLEDGVEITEFRIFDGSNNYNLLTTLGANTITPDYASTSAVIDLSAASISLPIGSYTAVMKLEYGNTEVNVCTLTVNVIGYSTSPAIEVIGDNPFCENGSFTLKAPVPSGAASTIVYKWYKGGTFLANTGTVPYFSGTDPDSYNCKLFPNSSSSTPIFTSTNVLITQTPNGIPSIIESNYTGQAARQLLAVGVPNINCSYLWNTGESVAGIDPGTTARYSNYKVYVTQPGGGCVNSNDISISKATCGSQTFTHQFSSSISDNYMANYVTSLTSLTAPNSLLIAGDFHFNRNFTIDCDVTIAPGAQIFVDNGYTLTLNTNSNIHACSKMWKGIQVASGGSLVMNGNATIADAEYGVIALEGCTLNINGGAGNCVFDKCYIGIQMPSYSTQKSYSIAKTKFNSSGALAPPYSGQTTFLGTKTNTGISALAKSTIVLTNVEFNGIEKGVVLNDGIINVSGTSNTINSKFLNLNYAIIATGISTIISSDCDFTNIVDPSIVSPIQSVAVNNTGTGSSTLLRNHFTNCDLAIRSTSGTAYYKENTFSNLNTAIEVITPTNKAVFIQANNIECRLGGINLSLMQDAATVEINGNFVEVGDLVSPTSASSYGVQYTATQANSNNYRHVIRYNNITLKSQGMAISSSFKSNLRIMSNIIELQKVGNLILDQVGIVCDHNGGGIVTCNDVTGDDNGAASQQNNMRIISCYNSNIMCNSVHGGGDGMRFTGNNGWVNLRTNYFDNDYRGLFLDNMTTSIGPQTHSGNFWSTTYSTSLNHFAAQNFSFNLGEEFKIDMTNSDPIYWPSAISPLSWFVTDINGGKEKGCIIEGKRGGITYQSPICGLHSSPFTQFREGHEITYSDTLIVSDTLPASLYAEEISTEAKMMLYERLSETRDVWDTIILFSMFYDSLENTNIGAFNEIEHVEQDKDSADKVLENNILFTDSLILWYTSIIAYNDSIGGDSLAAENVSHYATIESLLGAKDVYENLIENGRYSRTLLARQLNDDIDINNLSDQNRVLVNSIEYECIERGDYNYDKQEELVLSSIAHQCPQAGGDAVIAARALYGLRFPNEYYDDRNACLAEGFFRKSNPKNDLQKASPLSYFAISPNPTSDILTLNYYIADNTEIEFSMFNALQQKVKSEKLTAESKQYLTNCNDLSNGIYIYTLKSGDEIIFRGKISVIDQRQ